MGHALYHILLGINAGTWACVRARGIGRGGVILVTVLVTASAAGARRPCHLVTLTTSTPIGVSDTVIVRVLL